MIRFWTKVARGASDECWEWLAGKSGGYGVFHVNPKISTTAHRYSLQLATQQEGAGLFACHRCNNPGCVNPGHLYWGTQADNMEDAKAIGKAGGAPRQTHCGRGHEYTHETTLMVMNHGRPERQCRICNRQRVLRAYHKDVVKSRAVQNERNRRKSEQRATGVTQ
jgi:hypothetical protein